MKTMIKLLGITTVLVALAAFVGCERKHDDHAVGEATEQTMCPVMNAPIDKQYFVEYEGKKVFFCCPGCDKAFMENPEKYLDKLPQFQE